MKKMLLLIVFIMFFVGISCVSAENMNEIGASSSDDVISLDDDSSDTISSVESDVSTTNIDDEVICDSEPTRNNYSWAKFKSQVENTSINKIELNQGNIAPPMIVLIRLV